MKTVSLGKLTTLVSSGSTPLGGAKIYLSSGPVMLVRSQNVLMRELNLDDVAFITEEVASKMKRTVVKANDVLLNITGASIGRVATFELQGVHANVNQHVCIIRTIPELLHHRYLLHFIAQSSFQERINSTQHGGTRQALTFSQIRDFEIPLPPLEEQRRIAAILDKADAVRRKRQEAIALTEELLRSTFLEMFGDPATNPKEWETKRFGDVGTLERGKSKHRPRNDPSLLRGPYPLIQTGEVANCNGVIRSYTQTYSEKGLAQSKMWTAGTLCITIAANIAQTGILAFDACFPDSVVGFHAKSEVVTEYVQGWLGFLQPLIEERAPQVAQKNINLQILRELELPVPPINLQKTYSKFTLLLREHMTRSEQYQKDLDGLFNSLLQRAFRGEL